MSEIIHVEKGVGVAAGLAWRGLPAHLAPGAVPKGIRQTVSDAGASRFVTHTIQNTEGLQSALGFYQDDPLPPPGVKSLHSLAMLFVHLRASEGADLILAWRMPEDRVAVVVVHNGVPIADVIKPLEEARGFLKDALAGVLKPGNYIFYTNDPALFPNALVLTIDQLLAVGKKPLLLKKPPFNVAMVGAILFVAAVLALGFIALQRESDMAAANRLAAQKAANDPVPQYKLKLQAGLPKLGMDRNALLSTLSALSSTPLLVQGWAVKRIECSVDSCDFSFERAGGLLNELLAGFPNATVLPQTTPNLAVLHRVTALPFAGVKSRDEVPALAGGGVGFLNTLQFWQNAGVAIEGDLSSARFQVWPDPAPNDPAAIPPAVALKSAPVRLTFPYPVAADLINRAPPGFWCQSFAINLADGDINARVMLTLQGQFYVQSF